MKANGVAKAVSFPFVSLVIFVDRATFPFVSFVYFVDRTYLNKEIDMNLRNIILVAILGLIAYMFAMNFRDILRYIEIHEM